MQKILLSLAMEHLETSQNLAIFALEKFQENPTPETREYLAKSHKFMLNAQETVNDLKTTFAEPTL
jgi:hypothetical protein